MIFKGLPGETGEPMSAAQVRRRTRTRRRRWPGWWKADKALKMLVVGACGCQVAKKKAFEKLAPGLVTDDKVRRKRRGRRTWQQLMAGDAVLLVLVQGVCNYKGVAFTVADEICTAPLPNAHVS